MDESVDNVFHIDYKGLNRMVEDRNGQKMKIKYVKCPVCSNIMNRINFGIRSGVIIDRCKGHGVWLDGGQLKQLLEWRKAGGKLLHDKREDEEKSKRAKREASSKKISTHQSYDAYGINLSSHVDSDDDLFTSVANILFRLLD